MQTVKDVFVEFKAKLDDVYDAQEVDALALAVLNDISGLSNAYLKAFPVQELSIEQQEKVEDVLAQLITGKPLQYILGHTEFYGLPFKINSSVLIPRPETEELVDWVLKSDLSKTDNINILDIGTGSGCIAISLKKNLPKADVWAIDISTNALSVAKENAELNQVDINLIAADILQAPSTFHLLPSTFNLIISNPPYVTPADKELMHKNVTDFEPHAALFVPQNDPLLFYKAIANMAIEKLAAGGSLFFEINESYGDDTVNMLKQKHFRQVELRQDMSGRDRMVKAVK